MCPQYKSCNLVNIVIFPLRDFVKVDHSIAFTALLAGNDSVVTRLLKRNHFLGRDVGRLNNGSDVIA